MSSKMNRKVGKDKHTLEARGVMSMAMSLPSSSLRGFAATIVALYDTVVEIDRVSSENGAE